MKRVKVSDAALYAAFETYVQNRGSIRSFADEIGLSTDQAGCILRGKARRDVPRPPGFMYPWPETKRRRVSAEQLAEAYRRYQTEHLSIRAFSRLLGVTQYAGWLIFHGFLYKDAERPAVVVQHTPVAEPRKKLTGHV